MTNYGGSPLTGATVQRDGEMVEIEWEGGEPGLKVSVYASEDPEIKTDSEPITTSDEGRISVSGLEATKRYYFKLAPEHGPSINIAERRIRLNKTFNFRDIGGYETIGGQRVRWGRIFRSDGLSRLNDADRAYLKGMGLKLVMDFRSEDEAKKSPDLLPEDGGIEYLHLPIQTGELNFVTAMEKLKKGDDTWMTQDYMTIGYLKNLDVFPHIWSAAFKRLADAGSHPLVFHCTGGKDRAGTCAALTLLVLGVPEDEVIRDHQLSNVFIADMLPRVYKQLESIGVDPDKLKPYFTAPLEAIEALLDHLHKNYKNAENYLRTKAGLDDKVIESLRETMLE